jgi:hypothetical protein
VVPDDLCYQEQYGKKYRYKAGDSGALVEKITYYLNHASNPPDVSYWYSKKIVDEWYKVLATIY